MSDTGPNLVQRARSFALEAHKDCKYGDLSYEFHLSAVVNNLQGYSHEALAAGWLHDVVEDTDVTLNDIRTAFGGRVARLVDSVTDEPGNSRDERKRGMYKKLIVAPPEARAVKLADRAANMQASIENERMREVYRKEFPEFIRKVGNDYENRDLVLKCFWLYLHATEVSA